MKEVGTLIPLAGSGLRTYLVDLEARTATEEKVMHRTGKRYRARVTRKEMLDSLLKRAEAKAKRTTP
jgi:hypothetical protein